MGRYLSTNSCASSVNKTLRSYCKIRYLMILLRKYPRLAKAPLCLDLHRYSQVSTPHPFRFTRKGTSNGFTHSDIGSTSYLFVRDNTKGVKHLQIVRFYSSSNRNTFKAEAPIGIFEESENSYNLSSLGGRLGQSFNRLSSHINYYFKSKEVVPLAGNVSLMDTTQGYVGRSQRRSQSYWATRERKKTEGKETTETLKSKKEHEGSGANPPAQSYSGLQLFHISSLATTFGESYSYVANHINSAFSLGFAKVKAQETLNTISSTKGTSRRIKKRKVSNTGIINSNEAEISQVELDADKSAVEPSNTGHRQFATHINKYFGAKVEDPNKREPLPVERNSPYKEHRPTQPNSQTKSTASLPKKEEPTAPVSGGLFHSSSNATTFGENFFQMSGHINQYFKGEGELEEDIDRDVVVQMNQRSATSERLGTLTFMECLRHPTSAIPNLLGAYLNPMAQAKPKPAMTSPERILNKKFFLSQRQAEEITRRLIGSLAQASSPEALTACVDALNEHLIRYPSCKAVMWQEKSAVTLLRKRRTYRDNPELQNTLRETLALIGYLDPVKGRGIRVLSIDGGGTRGVVPLQVLKILEAETGKKIHQLFDYICGVSTGAVLAFMLGLAHFSLEECADMYRRFGSEVFRQNPLVGTVKMGWSHSYYNTETWETILQEKLGHRVLITTARDELSPKVSAVSAVVNWGTSPKAFVFRNYNHKPGSLSRYAGASGCEMWQAVRASSAAPGYFQEFTLQSDIHQDGGIILNNPCALAVHESRLLWPNQPFQCVLSLGTGRFDNVKRGPATSTSWRAKISNLISSATDTEGVHTLLDDLLAQDVYFRFNPMLSALVSLDESRPRALDQLQRDTQSYLERNRPKLARLCLVLGAERSAVSRTNDWISERAWEMKQRWV
ncbi:calcium-independent phospholipase A2-gamma-like [Notolabrus celidotus]|uniref:calcium-independent phospholipase A2-gamma-like n=1 Tax=Notolabrus celidotus TaxID=1203425 RepID=UPI00148F5104|nr:calcium-independent phospholipase A2-gamma-like [Notolabrus celidotus]XP_034550973.1 calcium-independent phospholipase A2-gamma-like [Notolabrus celidotus]XP_034550974.1 calcium-independent phospholipase A2-gamma-like [Notolabrus celidotus]XP_034550975.1 calcium-independent phospholipase A2-gamma-like [Notolabrus celidotus]